MLKYFVFFLTFLFFSCQIEFNEFTKISFQEVIEIAKNNNDFELVLLDHKNAKLKEPQIKKLNFENYTSEFRIDSFGKVYRKIIFNNLATIEERMNQVIYLNLYLLRVIDSDTLIDINCNDFENIVDTVYRRDQEIRKEIRKKKIEFKEFLKIDQENCSMIESLLSKCDIDEKYINKIWLLIQHSPLKIQIKYYEYFDSLYHENKLASSKIALLRDRILLRSGYHQEYGSQTAEGINHKIYNFAKIDSIRRSMNLMPFDEYLKLLMPSKD